MNLPELYTDQKPPARIYEGDKLIYPEPVKDGLVLWYDFMGRKNSDAKRGIADDLSGNGNLGELMNFGFVEGSGYLAKGLMFDGIDDYTETPIALDYAEGFSVEVYVKAFVEGGVITGRVASELSGTAGNRFLIQIRSNDSFRVRYWHPTIAGSDFAFSRTDYFNKARHLLFTYKDGLSFIYGDGVLLGQKTYDMGYSGTDLINIWLGRYSGGGAVHMAGDLFMTRIYNRALTPEEIAHNYAMEKERWNL